MSCDPVNGCPPDTHNLHCDYPNCAKGRAGRPVTKQSYLTAVKIDEIAELARKGYASPIDVLVLIDNLKNERAKP